MKSAITALLVASVAIGAVFGGPSSGIENGGKEFTTPEASQLIDWYTCTAQGNYPDPTTCDHYIACTTANLAYQMPCAMGPNNLRLYYVRDSGPKEQTSYCDWRENVYCPVGVTDEPVTSTQTPVVTSDKPVVTSDKPVVTSDKPIDTTQDPGTGTPGLTTCTELNITLGDSCNPQVDCKQCGYCEDYLYCPDNGSKVSQWTQGKCGERNSADQEDGVILTKNKLFWSPNVTPHGGRCDLYENLDESVKGTYRDDVECKPVCIFEEHPTCDRKYYYTDPDFHQGIWKGKRELFECPEGTQWEQDQVSCVFCKDDNTCNANC